MNRDKILRFDWGYDAYLAVTNREDSEQSADRWAEVIDLIENKYSERIDDEINSAIRFVDDWKIKEK